VTEETVRPAWYALRAGGWRDWVTLLHPPYTLWNLSYVAVGAALAPRFHFDRLLWALAAFFLAMGVAAHALDELNGRPLRTAIPSPALAVAAFVALGGAIGIGLAAANAWGWWLLVFVAVGAVLVPAYNLELFGGVLHNDWGFALAWGAHGLVRGGAVDPVRGGGDRRLRRGAQPGAAHSLDARPPRAALPGDARGHRDDRAHVAVVDLRSDRHRRRRGCRTPTMNG
jgi:hypothetical protein